MQTIYHFLKLESQQHLQRSQAISIPRFYLIHVERSGARIKSGQENHSNKLFGDVRICTLQEKCREFYEGEFFFTFVVFADFFAVTANFQFNVTV